jgi:hypothetical protein
MNNVQKGKGSKQGVKSETAGNGLADELSALESALEDLTGQKGNADAGSKQSSSAVPRPTAGANGGAGARNGTAGGVAKATGAGVRAPKPTGIPGNVEGNSTGGAGRVVGLITATPEAQDVEYLSPVIIGGQTINMDFDSGSSDLWVFNNQLPQAAQSGHQNFDIQRSSTFKMIEGASFNISYGDGSGAAGNVGTDTVDIGGATVTSQAIELATEVSDSFVQDQANNGLVGLAFSSLNTVKPIQQKTFFDNVMPSLAEPVFTADLRAAAVGSYEFGRIDESKFNGSLTWSAVNTAQGFWQFSSDKFQVGDGQPLEVAGAQAIADTGTTLMLVNPAVVNAYYSQVTGAVNSQSLGGVTFPCNANLPDLMVAIGESMALIRGSDINFAQVDNNGDSKSTSILLCSIALMCCIACFGGVQAIESDLQIYGDIMFKSQFVVFHGGNNSLGFAPHQ